MIQSKSKRIILTLSLIIIFIILDILLRDAFFFRGKTPINLILDFIVTSFLIFLFVYYILGPKQKDVDYSKERAFLKFSMLFEILVFASFLSIYITAIFFNDYIKYPLLSLAFTLLPWVIVTTLFHLHKTKRISFRLAVVLFISYFGVFSLYFVPKQYQTPLISSLWLIFLLSTMMMVFYSSYIQFKYYWNPTNLIMLEYIAKIKKRRSSSKIP